MMQGIFKFMFIMSVASTLTACATTHMTTIQQDSELAYGKKLFETGYYKSALRELLPVACNNNAEAEYAVGYMYYYGYGAAQDTDIGYFWIKRAADHGYGPAREALNMIEADSKFRKPVHSHDKLAQAVNADPDDSDNENDDI